MNKQVELEASTALLDIGVSIPLLQWKIPFTKRHITLRLVMRRPKFGTQIRIARKFLSMGVTYEQMQNFTKDEQLQFIARHGKTVAQMVALTICRSKVSAIFAPLLAWLLLWLVDDTFLLLANLHFIPLIGTQHFTNIIKSLEWSNPLRPRLSQVKKGS